MPLFGKSRDDQPNAEQPVPYELQEVQQMAQQGRRLAIYDRGTGLYAYWYLQLRGDEETARASRYTKQLSLLSIWAATAEAIERVSASLKQKLRENDLAGYLNNGHFVVLLLETPPEGAQVVCERLLTALGEDVEIGLASYPDHGDNFDALLAAAKTDGEARAAA